MEFSFLSVTDIRWPQIINDLPYDIYHLPEYLKFSAKHEGGEPVAFYAKENNTILFIPMLLRVLPQKLKAPPEWKDAVSPYGYASPLCNSKNNSELYSLLNVFRNSCQNNNIITYFGRFHPLFEAPFEIYEKYGTVINQGQTIYIDLTKTTDIITQQTRKSIRYDIRKLEKDGYRTVTDEWDYYNEFVQIYNETMRRQNADQFYYFSNKYFQDIKDYFYDNLHLCTVLAPNGDISCGALFFECRGILQYHLSGTKESYLKLAPTKLMLHDVKSWAIKSGLKSFHLGGGVGGKNDSLFQFKSGFSESRSDFCTFRMVIDEKKYFFLCGKDASANSTGFFPDYRSLSNNRS